MAKTRKGKRDLGAPDLTDATWIYGGDRQSIHTAIYSGHQGHMPHWEERLSTTQRKILALYVLSLSEKITVMAPAARNGRDQRPTDVLARSGFWRSHSSRQDLPCSSLPTPISSTWQ